MFYVELFGLKFYIDPPLRNNTKGALSVHDLSKVSEVQIKILSIKFYVYWLFLNGQQFRLSEGVLPGTFWKGDLIEFSSAFIEEQTEEP